MSIRETWRWIVFSLTGRVPGSGGSVRPWTPTSDEQPALLSEGKEITDPDEAEALGLTADARRMRERRVVGADEAAGLGLTGLWDCPTCGPASLEPHPRLAVIRCSNCKERVRGTKHPDTPDDTRTGPLTAALGGDRTAKVIAHTLGTHGYSLAAVHGMSDAELLAVPGIGETSLTWIREHVAGSEPVHASPPPGSGVTPCCGKTPFELPRADRMTLDADAVTCDRSAANWHKEERRLIAECRDTDDCCAVDTCRLDAHRLLPHSDTVKVPRDALRRLVRVVQHAASDSYAVGMDQAQRALAALDDAGLLDQLREEDH